MASSDPNPFGDSRRERRARALEAMLDEDAAIRRMPAGPTRTERAARHIGAAAARSRFRLAARVLLVALEAAATLTRPARRLAATLQRSGTVKAAWTGFVLVIFFGSIIYALVTGEGAGPS